MSYEEEDTCMCAYINRGLGTERPRCTTCVCVCVCACVRAYVCRQTDAKSQVAIFG